MQGWQPQKVSPVITTTHLTAVEGSATGNRKEKEQERRKEMFQAGLGVMEWRKLSAVTLSQVEL